MELLREEHDLIGDRGVPAEAYYGIHTLRALENFPLTGRPVSSHPELVVAMAAVKEAAALAHRELGVLPTERADAIVEACREIRAGRHHEHFVVDVFQGGAGTSANMNANEVIANRALELLGRRRGEYEHLHPNDDVNRSQSTNDAYPTAVKIALYSAAGRLLDAMSVLANAFTERGGAFAKVVKLGRTQLQDAVPMTLGQEFDAFALTVRDDADLLTRSRGALLEVNVGGTAIGTGLNADAGFTASALAYLAVIASAPVRPARDRIESTQSMGSFIQLSSSLKQFALRLSKICNDLRLLCSGPRAGLAEIRLPALQAGSSIMPGKINPVLPEAVNQVCFDVVGADAAVSAAAQAGQLQLNAFEPLIVHHLLNSLNRLEAACRVLAQRCVRGIEADEARLREFVETSASLATALNPVLGYQRASDLARESLETGTPVRALAAATGLLTEEELDARLDLWSLAHPR
ncbi:aspartate ammonia-lyase [Streptomyces sp. NPDC058128]|uniref:aspartate ammonia-lyase n=1 Tax=unclassified Streptomyces TaxID=2593676 RepID=UPI00093ADF9F|nr:aspartate ammonia-lyase [Streptomyces sp. CB02009]OKJ48982.1 aspartate ammonia-lyase [Streptomyces sp. CB02009]